MYTPCSGLPIGKNSQDSWMMITPPRHISFPFALSAVLAVCALLLTMMSTGVARADEPIVDGPPSAEELQELEETAPFVPTDMSASGHVIIVPEILEGVTPYLNMARYFQSLGYSTSLLELASRDIPADAHAIEREVDRVTEAHPGRPISIVGHGNGGLSARWYLKVLEGHPKVQTYVAIGTPQYGRPHGCDLPLSALTGPACADDEIFQTLNEGDDTPGDTYYASIRSTEEWTSGDLTGGQCHMKPIQGRPLLGTLRIEHFIEPVYAEYLYNTYSAISHHCDGLFVDDPFDSITAEDTFNPAAQLPEPPRLPVTEPRPEDGAEQPAPEGDPAPEGEPAPDDQPAEDVEQPAEPVDEPAPVEGEEPVEIIDEDPAVVEV